MLKVSDLLGKPLLALTEAKTMGYIGNLWFDAKLRQAKTAEIINDDDDNFPERSFVEFRHLQCDGDAAVIKTINLLLPINPVSAVLPCPINRISYTQSGKAMGKVRELVIEGREVTQIVCDSATFTPAQVLSFSDNLCIFNDTGVRIALAKPKPANVRKPKTPAPVSQTPESTSQAAPAVPQPPQVQTPTQPQSVTVTHMPGAPTKDYSFLLGKTVHSPIIHNSRTLIAAGTVVNEQTIELARKYAKLVQLALRAY